MVDLFIVLGIPGLILFTVVFSMYCNYKDSELENQKEQLESRAWENAQSQLPKYRLKIKDSSGVIYYSLPADAFRQVCLGDFGWKIEATSKERAYKQADAIIKHGGFQCHVTGDTIPACNIVKIEVVEV